MGENFILGCMLSNRIRKKTLGCVDIVASSSCPLRNLRLVCKRVDVDDWLGLWNGSSTTMLLRKLRLIAFEPRHMLGYWLGFRSMERFGISFLASEFSWFSCSLMPDTCSLSNICNVQWESNVDHLSRLLNIVVY